MLPPIARSDRDGMARWRLHGVRLDTSATLRDCSLARGFGDGRQSAKLVFTVREALNSSLGKLGCPARSWNLSRARFAGARKSSSPADSIGSGSPALNVRARQSTATGLARRFLSNDRRSEFRFHHGRRSGEGRWANGLICRRSGGAPATIAIWSRSISARLVEQALFRWGTPARDRLRLASTGDRPPQALAEWRPRNAVFGHYPR